MNPGQQRPSVLIAVTLASNHALADLSDPSHRPVRPGGEIEGRGMENVGSPEPLREVNDRAFGYLRRSGAERGDFACECGSQDCSEQVELLLIEYAAREDQPLLAPGHRQNLPVIG
jgi:hypothetical protein